MSRVSMPPDAERTFGSEAQRKALGRAFFNLLEHWDLSNEEQARLLGWSYKNKRSKFEAMREGSTEFPQDEDKIERATDLINIHKSLRVLFPYNRKLVYEWIKVPRERFGGHSALDIFLEDGKEGIRAIRRYLDHERCR